MIRPALTKEALANRAGLRRRPLHILRDVWVMARSNKRVQRSRRSEVRVKQSAPLGGPLTRIVMPLRVFRNCGKKGVCMIGINNPLRRLLGVIGIALSWGLAWAAVFATFVLMMSIASPQDIEPGD